MPLDGPGTSRRWVGGGKGSMTGQYDEIYQAWRRNPREFWAAAATEAASADGPGAGVNRDPPTSSARR